MTFLGKSATIAKVWEIFGKPSSLAFPEFQGKGIESGMLDRILKYIEIRTPVGGRASVQLIAEKGKEEFYIKKGFKRIPHEFCGSGMRKVIRK